MGRNTAWTWARSCAVAFVVMSGAGIACSLINSYPAVVPALPPEASSPVAGAIVVGGKVPADGGDAGDQFVLTALDPSTGLEFPGARTDLTVSAVVYDTYGNATNQRSLWYVFSTGGGQIFPLPGQAFTLHTMQLAQTTTPPPSGSQWQEVGHIEIPAGVSYATTAAALNYVGYVAYGDPDGGAEGGCTEDGGFELPSTSYALIVLDTSNPSAIQCAVVRGLESASQPVALVATPPVNQGDTYGGNLWVAYKLAGQACGAASGSGASDSGGANDAGDASTSGGDGSAGDDGSGGGSDGSGGSAGGDGSANGGGGADDDGGSTPGEEEGGSASGNTLPEAGPVCAPASIGALAEIVPYTLTHDPISGTTSASLQSSLSVCYPQGATDVGFAPLLFGGGWGVLVAVGAAQGGGTGMLTFYPLSTGTPTTSWCFPFFDPVIKAPAVDPCSSTPVAFVTGTNGTPGHPNAAYAISLGLDGGFVADPGAQMLHSGQTLSYEPTESTLLAPFSEENDNFTLSAFAFDIGAFGSDGGAALTLEMNGSPQWSPPSAVRPSFVATRLSAAACP
ncbi:MAG TPA: hypothetical protein VEK07_14160 [Polyangiaceae bacterium]|nr:hypothetical protein [Polyangiaceae bacterium]